jgi:hypothetical protein
VQAAVNSAASGDTVVVPAGSCSWTSGVNIPNGKHITLRGAGINVTTITRGDQQLTFNLNGSATRITGFTFQQGQIVIGGDNATPVQDFRIDHNRFVGGNYNGYVAIEISCPFAVSPTGTFCRGLVDNNTFEAGAVARPMGFAAASSLHAAWSIPTNLGGQDTVFIEDNSFSAPSGSLWHYIDTNYAGRFVFRFNTTASMGAEVHSLQGWRGSRAWEIYKNTMNGSGWTAGLIRGGVGVSWGNTISSGIGPWTLDNVRSYNTGYDYGNCNGSSTADGNQSGGQGYVCRDQLGSGRDVCLSNPSSRTASATGWCTQTREPSYFWLNRTGSAITAIDTSGRGLSTTHHVLSNRDFYNEVGSFNGTAGVGQGPLAGRPSTCTIGTAYWATDQGEWNSKNSGPDGQLYKCTAPNTWTLYYRPYQYPHPLQSGSTTTSPPAAPSNLRVIR